MFEPLSSVAVARDDVDIVGAGLDRHARGLQIVAITPARQQYLSDWNTVLTEQALDPDHTSRHRGYRRCQRASNLEPDR